MIRHFEILIVIQTTKYHVGVFGKLKYGVSLYTTTRRYFCNRESTLAQYLWPGRYHPQNNDSLLHLNENATVPYESYIATDSTK